MVQLTDPAEILGQAAYGPIACQNPLFLIRIFSPASAQWLWKLGVPTGAGYTVASHFEGFRLPELAQFGRKSNLPLRTDVILCASCAHGGVMFCPNCGLNEDRTVQFCRTCGTDLGAVRDTLEQPHSVSASTATAREEIARAAAAKIKEGQWWQVGAIVPEVEKLFESPEDRRLRLIRAAEEQRLRRIRTGVVTAASGLGAVLIFLLFSFALKDALFLIGPSLAVLLIGLGIVINGLLFTKLKQSALEGSPDGPQRHGLDLQPGKVIKTGEVLAPPEPSLLRPSVTEQTTRHLSSDL